MHIHLEREREREIGIRRLPYKTNPSISCGKKGPKVGKRIRQLLGNGNHG